MMKKKILAVKILACLIAIFLIGTIAISSIESDTTVKVESFDSVGVPMSNISAIGLSNPSGTIAMILKADGIEVAGENTSDFSQEELMAFVYEMTHITSTTEISDLENASDYGMENPSAFCVMMLANGEEMTLALLNKSSIGNQYYMYNSYLNKIYMIDSKYADYMMRERSDFTDKTLFPSIGIENVYEINSLSIKNANSESCSYIVEGVSNGEFKLTSPMDIKISVVEFYTDLISPLTSVYPSKVIGTVEDLSEYNLDNPEIEISLVFQDKEYNASISKIDSVYYMLYNNIVYAFTEESFGFVGVSYMDLLKNNAYTYNLGDLVTIKAEGSANILIDILGSGTEMVGTCGGKQMDYLKMQEIFKPLNSVQILARTNEDFQNPTLTLEFTSALGAVDKIEFSNKQADGSVLVKVNGVVNFSTTEKYVIDIENMINSIL